MTIKRALVRAAIAVAGAAALAAVSSPAPAAATARNGVCEVGEFCLYWGPNRTGSLSDFIGSIDNYGSTQPTCYEFRGSGTGQFKCVKNNAESAWNRTTANTVTVYFNSNFGGPSDVFTPGQTKNLVNTFLNNASHRFVHN
jgi:Peptidase inhibitor family I36